MSCRCAQAGARERQDYARSRSSDACLKVKEAAESTSLAPESRELRRERSRVMGKGTSVHYHDLKKTNNLFLKGIVHFEINF